MHDSSGESSTSSLAGRARPTAGGNLIPIFNSRTSCRNAPFARSNQPASPDCIPRSGAITFGGGKAAWNWQRPCDAPARAPRTGHGLPQRSKPCQAKDRGRACPARDSASRRQATEQVRTASGRLPPYICPGLVEDGHLLRTHAEELVAVSSTGRHARRSHSSQASCSHLRGNQRELEGLCCQALGWGAAATFHGHIVTQFVPAGEPCVLAMRPHEPAIVAGAWLGHTNPAREYTKV